MEKIENITDEYGEIKKTDVSQYLEQLENPNESATFEFNASNVEALNRWKESVKENPTTKAIKEKLGIK